MTKKLQIKLKKGESKGNAFARAILSPSTRHAVTTELFTMTLANAEEFDTKSIEQEMQKKIDNVKDGDLSDIEATLVVQATTLDAIFHDMAHRAALNMGEYLQATETYMRIALKAQSQCRCTIEALNEIKNPKHITITKQANISNQQIVDNRTLHSGSSPAREKPIPSNELLTETISNEKMDTRRTPSPTRANTSRKTMGKIDRSKNCRR